MIITTDFPEEVLCKKCDKIFPLSKFRIRNYNQKKRIEESCYFCQNQRARERENSSIESKIHKLLLGAKHRTIRNKLDFNITEQDLLNQFKKQKGLCFYTGEKLNISVLSIDRVNPKIGYTKKNIVLTCWRVNLLKNNMDCQEFLRFCKKIATFSAKK